MFFASLVLSQMKLNYNIFSQQPENEGFVTGFCTCDTINQLHKPAEVSIYTAAEPSIPHFNIVKFHS
ncbi:hypothetical protein ACFX1T_043879 [Malus domestica]